MGEVGPHDIGARGRGTPRGPSGVHHRRAAHICKKKRETIEKAENVVKLFKKKEKESKNEKSHKYNPRALLTVKLNLAKF